MVTATIVDSSKVKSQLHRSLPAPPCAAQMAAQASRRLASVDVGWLAVRESQVQTAGICCRDGARSPVGMGLVNEPGVGVGEAPLLTLELWPGEVSGDGRTIHAEHAGVGKRTTGELELPVER